jgi:hypothetical protein
VNLLVGALGDTGRGAKIPGRRAKFAVNVVRMAVVDAWLAILKVVFVSSAAVAVVSALIMAGSGFFIIKSQHDILVRHDTELEIYQQDLAAKIAQARSEGASAAERAATATERAARLEKEAREAQLDLEKLKQQVAPRHLRRAQAEQLIRILRGHPFTLPVVVLPNDHEAAAYAREIVNALSEAGMTIQRAPLYSDRRTGLILSGQRSPEYNLLLTAFELANVPVIQGPLETEFPPENWSISLTIGSRL